MNTGRNPLTGFAPPLRGHVYRDFARLAAEALAVGLVVSLALALAIFIVSTQAEAADSGTVPGQGTAVVPGHATRGRRVVVRLSALDLAGLPHPRASTLTAG